MTEGQVFGIVILSVIFLIIVIISLCGNNYSLNIKRKSVGNGQHGTARFSTNSEIQKSFIQLKYEPEQWRNGINLPKTYGTIVSCANNGKATYALIDTQDVHTLMIAAAGAGKTAYFEYPNIEYACAAGMSFISTDTKGDIYRNCGYIAAKYYGYKVSVIDLRNPTKSDGNNILYLVNKYMQLYKDDNKNVTARAKAEKYAKIAADSIITTEGNMGANTYFYDSAKGLLAAVILILAEYGKDGECHIVSVLKLMTELLKKHEKEKEKEKETTGKKPKQPQPPEMIMYFTELMDYLPDEHKAKWLAGAALNNADQAMLSAVSTALSKLNAFIDSELEQILCFDTLINAETFCNEKCAIFIVMPEEDRTKYVIVNLIIQQLCREIYEIADENGGKLTKRVMMYLDEFGTLPKIECAEMLFSAARSRGISIVPIIQSFAQLEKNYGKSGKEIIVDNTQLTIFGGFAPNSSSAEALSKSLGNQTVMSGSVSHGGGTQRNSQQLQMMGRPLMTADELKTMPKGQFVVMKTGIHPMVINLKLFTEWGITYKRKYEIQDKGARKVLYADKNTLMQSVKTANQPQNNATNNTTDSAKKKIKEMNIIDFSGDYPDDPFLELSESKKKVIRT